MENDIRKDRSISIHKPVDMKGKCGIEGKISWDSALKISIVIFGRIPVYMRRNVEVTQEKRIVGIHPTPELGVF